MRLKLVLHQTEKRVALPINTGYLIGSAIYRTLANASPEFAARMHEYGYGSPGARQNFRLFTFSNIDVPKRSIQGSQLISESEHISFLISSPMEDFLQMLITGLFSDGQLRLGNVAFEKERIETLPDPAFSGEMSFTMLSPMTMSVMRQDESSRIKEYLRYDDERLPKLLLQNLFSKYQSIYGKPFFDADPKFNIRFNEAYIDRKRQQGRTIEKLITIAAGTERETRVKAIECPFRLTTHPDLIRVGYECGFGENNSMGFGMVKVE